MNAFILTLFSILFTVITASAQTGSISGQVLDSTGTAYDGAVLSLLSAGDSSLIKTAISDPDGTFSLQQLTLGDYLLIVNAEGHESFSYPAITLNETQPQQQLQPVKLLAKPSEQLDEIVVVAKIPLVERKIDRTVVNVDQMISAAGSNVWEVLQKSPGIMMDQNNNILLKGKGGVLIYIDDKQTYLSGDALQNYLKAMPASSISQIEIMTNPPARYDAAGNIGIINIVTKKSKMKGFNGSFNITYGQGRYMRQYNNFTFNYRNNKLNVFGNISPGLSNGYSDLYIYRTYRNEDLSVKSTFDQNTVMRSRILHGNYRFGIDYYLNDKSTLGITTNGTLTTFKNWSRNIADVGNEFGQPERIVIADNDDDGMFRNNGANINFRHKFDSTGRQLTMDLDYINYGMNSNEVYLNNTYSPDGEVTATDLLEGDLPGSIHILAYKTDYSRPMKKDAQLDFGMKSSFTQIDNLVDYRYTVGGVTTPDYDKSNHFIYRENINAAYVNLRKTINRFGFQLGLRAEGTLSRGNQLGNPAKPSSTFNRDYFNLFPTAFFSYNLDSAANNQLTASYGRRIDRPYYQDLNPFVRPLDKFTYYGGNPQLRPTFAHNFAIGYSYKSYFSTELSCNITRNDIAETIEIDANDMYFSRPGNIGRRESVNLSVNGNIPIGKWYTMNFYAETGYQQYHSQLYTETLNSNSGYFFVQSSHTFTFKKGWGAELSGYYVSGQMYAQFFLEQRGQLTIAFQKAILKDKGKIRVAFNDVLYTGINNGTINNLHLTDAHYTNRNDTRTVFFTFSYSFGKPFDAAPRHQGGSSESEQQRVRG